MKKYKVIFADLDGTLINTVSGETFPKGIWDMKFNVDALEAIKQLQPYYLLIVSNQGGIEKDFLTARDFKTKLYYVTQAITDYTHVTCVGTFCESNDKNDPRRKPNPGMLSQWNDINSLFPKSKMLMIGDASGKPGQFSDSDKRTAENFGIDYMDINDFIAAALDSPSTHNLK